MEIVAGISLKNLNPRFWDSASPFYLPQVRAVMVSYADFYRMPARRARAMELGLHAYLGVPDGVSIYLDNGAFYFLNRSGETPRADYEEFVARTRPDWRPIPQDFIPTPTLTREAQLDCLRRTMDVNAAYTHDGFVPVIHVSDVLQDYIDAVRATPQLMAKPAVAVGGLVPHLLRTSNAMPYSAVVAGLRSVREAFRSKALHLFGVGSTATLHLAMLLDFDSVDSSGWRNRAARGIVQLPGRGDRIVAELGSWRGRRPDADEWRMLGACGCPSCRQFGLDGLRASGTHGFCCRAAHNLWLLVDEARLIQMHRATGTYREWYKGHIVNSVYSRLIDQLVEEVK